MIELPVPRRPADCNEPTRTGKFLKPTEFIFARPCLARRITDRKAQLEQVLENAPGILGCGDLKVEVGDLCPRIPDVHELGAPTGLPPDVPSHRDAGITDTDHEVRPGRRDQGSRLFRNALQSNARERQAPHLIEGNGLGLEGEAKGAGKRAELIIVAGSRAHEQPDQRQSSFVHRTITHLGRCLRMSGDPCMRATTMTS